MAEQHEVHKREATQKNQLHRREVADMLARKDQEMVMLHQELQVRL